MLRCIEADIAPVGRLAAALLPLSSLSMQVAAILTIKPQEREYSYLLVVCIRCYSL